LRSTLTFENCRDKQRLCSSFGTCDTPLNVAWELWSHSEIMLVCAKRGDLWWKCALRKKSCLFRARCWINLWYLTYLELDSQQWKLSSLNGCYEERRRYGHLFI
jgi:hypothetical protein